MVNDVKDSRMRVGFFGGTRGEVLKRVEALGETRGEVLKRIGVFGGTFDPPHNGHVEIAHAALEMCALDVLFVMPAGTPVYKLDKKVTPAQQRLEMCRLAFGCVEGTSVGIRVSDAEIARGGKTYTAHTLQALREEYPSAELFFVAGADAAATIPKWKDAQTIAQLATIVVVGRGNLREGLGAGGTEADGAKDAGGDTKGAPAFKDLVSDFNVMFLDDDVQNVSSSEVRERVRRGESVDSLVPPQVEAYIRERGLYI